MRVSLKGLPDKLRGGAWPSSARTVRRAVKSVKLAKLEKFYLVRDPDTNKILCSFAIESEDEIAVLKFFGVRKSLQKNGVGKYVANKTCELMKKNGIKRFYASTWEAPEFWRKTLFKEIKISEIKDKYFLNYLKQLEKSFPYEYSNLLVNFCFSA